MRPFPFRMNLHVPRYAELRGPRGSQKTIIVDDAALNRAKRALQWHEERTKQQVGT